MRDAVILSRRAAAALPLAALLGPAAAAIPATAAAADAALIDLGRRWEALLAAERALNKTFFVDEPMSRAEALEHDRIGNELSNARSEIFDQIERTPASTPAGLAVKARVVACENDLEQFDEASIVAALAATRFLNDRAALSLALDCLRMARAPA